MPRGIPSAKPAAKAVPKSVTPSHQKATQSPTASEFPTVKISDEQLSRVLNYLLAAGLPGPSVNNQGDTESYGKSAEGNQAKQAARNGSGWNSHIQGMSVQGESGPPTTKQQDQPTDELLGTLSLNLSDLNTTISALEQKARPYITHEHFQQISGTGDNGDNDAMPSGWSPMVVRLTTLVAQLNAAVARLAEVERHIVL